MRLSGVLEYRHVYGERVAWADVRAAISRMDSFQVFGLATQWNALVQGPRGEFLADESWRIVWEMASPEQAVGIRRAIAQLRPEVPRSDLEPPPIVHRRALLILLNLALRGEHWDPDGQARLVGPALVDALLGINEHLEPPHSSSAPEVIFAQMLALADFSHPRNIEAGVTRMLRMVREIRPVTKTPRDVRDLFAAAISLPLETYLALAFSAALVTTPQFGLEPGERPPTHGNVGLPNLWPTRLCGDSAVTPQQATAFLEIMAFTPAKLVSSLAQAGPAQTDFSTFRRSPFIALGSGPNQEDIYRLLDRTMAADKLADGPYWATHVGAPKTGVSIQEVNASWGLLFEGYCHQLIENTPGLGGAYIRNPAFRDSPPKSEDADGLVIVGNAWVVFEFKFGPLTVQARSGAPGRHAIKEILRKYGRRLGAGQLARVAGELLRGRALGTGPLPTTATLYPVLVAWDPLLGCAPMVNGLLNLSFQRSLTRHLKQRDPRARPLTVLAIEDLEAMLACTDTASIPAMLERWLQEPNMGEAPSWVLSTALPHWQPYAHPWVREAAERWKTEMLVRLWPDGETARTRQGAKGGP